MVPMSSSSSQVPVAPSLRNGDMPPLPRPVERLPEFAHLAARKKLAERLTEAFGMPPEAARAVADAVTDPSAVRKRIGDAEDPAAEAIPVPGGVIFGLRTDVWAERVMPDARNPRVGPAKKHPAAVAPGGGGEGSRHRPLPDPRTPDGEAPETPALQVDVANPDHLAWASREAAKYVLANNDWRSSIEGQGVLQAVWLAATTYTHADGTEPACALTTVEGSSRTTAVHDILGVNSAGVPYDDADRRFRADVNALNRKFDDTPQGEMEWGLQKQLRCARVPGLILVGFRPHDDQTGGFPTAIKSLVALRHVDPPKPWGTGVENEQFADEAVAELLRRGRITPRQRDYLVGALTRAEAEAAGFSGDPAVRAAYVVRQFTMRDREANDAIRHAVTSMSTREKLGSRLRREMAAALILRAVDKDPKELERVRKYMTGSGGAFPAKVVDGEWEPTARSAADLAAAARAEVEAAALEPDGDADPGPASRELAVRAAFPLLVTGTLSGDRGTRGNDQPDRRPPGEVVNAMRKDPAGVLQLRRALTDYAQGAGRVRLTDAAGEPVAGENGTPVYADDVRLRYEYPAPGRPRAKLSDDTAENRLENALRDLGEAFGRVRAGYETALEVRTPAGAALVEEEGVEPRRCGEWKELIAALQEDLTVWGRLYRRRQGLPGRAASVAAVAEDREEADDDGEDSAGDWDDPAGDRDDPA